MITSLVFIHNNVNIKYKLYAGILKIFFFKLMKSVYLTKP